jgi:hypothetical protein
MVDATWRARSLPETRCTKADSCGFWRIDDRRAAPGLSLWALGIGTGSDDGPGKQKCRADARFRRPENRAKLAGSSASPQAGKRDTVLPFQARPPSVHPHLQPHTPAPPALLSTTHNTTTEHFNVLYPLLLLRPTPRPRTTATRLPSSLAAMVRLPHAVPIPYPALGKTSRLDPPCTPPQ